jgi:hypothetical protein
MSENWHQRGEFLEMRQLDAAKRDKKEASLFLELSVLTPIILMYLFLAFYRIDHQSLWLDEVVSLEAAAPDKSVFSRALWMIGQGPLSQHV